VDYLALGRDGAIRKANLVGAIMLGVERARLPGRRFGVFVVEPDRDGFKSFLETVFTSMVKEECEVALLNGGREPLKVFITAAISQNGQECRLMMVGISKRNQADNTHEVQYAGETGIPIQRVFLA
jgi:hypothetical protein